jgi:hypothetical protein
MKPDAENFKIEPDLSGGVDLVELITGPLPYVEAKIILLKILKLMQDNTHTDEKCSIHINISFDKKSGKELYQLNPLKLILDMDEKLVYKFFPNRENNFYAKSIKKLIPFKDYKFSTDAMKLVTSNIELPDTCKYLIFKRKRGYFLPFFPYFLRHNYISVYCRLLSNFSILIHLVI